MKHFLSAAVIVSAIAVSACQKGQGPDWFSKENVGTVAGAGLGAWAGSNVGKGSGNVAAIAGGTLLGALLGKEVGASLDRADMAHYQDASQRALETAQTGNEVAWQNPDSGNRGTITPTRTFQRANGTYCREYNQTIYIGGEAHQGHGTACRQPDGTWKIVQ